MMNLAELYMKELLMQQKLGREFQHYSQQSHQQPSPQPYNLPPSPPTLIPHLQQFYQQMPATSSSTTAFPSTTLFHPKPQYRKEEPLFSPKTTFLQQCPPPTMFDPLAAAVAANFMQNFAQTSLQPQFPAMTSAAGMQQAIYGFGGTGSSHAQAQQFGFGLADFTQSPSCGSLNSASGSCVSLDSFPSSSSSGLPSSPDSSSCCSTTHGPPFPLAGRTQQQQHHFGYAQNGQRHRQQSQFQEKTQTAARSFPSLQSVPKRAAAPTDFSELASQQLKVQMPTSSKASSTPKTASAIIQHQKRPPPHQKLQQEQKRALATGKQQRANCSVNRDEPPQKIARKSGSTIFVPLEFGTTGKSSVTITSKAMTPKPSAAPPSQSQVSMVSSVQRMPNPMNTLEHDHVAAIASVYDSSDHQQKAAFGEQFIIGQDVNIKEMPTVELARDQRMPLNLNGDGIDELHSEGKNAEICVGIKEMAKEGQLMESEQKKSGKEEVSAIDESKKTEGEAALDQLKHTFCNSSSVLAEHIELDISAMEDHLEDEKMFPLLVLDPILVPGKENGGKKKVMEEKKARKPRLEEESDRKIVKKKNEVLNGTKRPKEEQKRGEVLKKRRFSEVKKEEKQSPKRRFSEVKKEENQSPKRRFSEVKKEEKQSPMMNKALSTHQLDEEKKTDCSLSEGRRGSTASSISSKWDLASLMEEHRSFEFNTVEKNIGNRKKATASDESQNQQHHQVEEKPSIEWLEEVKVGQLLEEEAKKEHLMDEEEKDDDDGEGKEEEEVQTTMVDDGGKAGEEVETEQQEKLVLCGWAKCKQRFLDQDQLYDHLNIAHIEPLKKWVLTEQRELEQQRKTGAGGLRRRRSNGTMDNGKERFRCCWHKCEQFPRRGDAQKKLDWLLVHLINRHAPKARPYSCLFTGCTLRFPKVQALNDHLRSAHDNTNVRGAGRKSAGEETKVSWCEFRPRVNLPILRDCIDARTVEWIRCRMDGCDSISLFDDELADEPPTNPGEEEEKFQRAKARKTPAISRCGGGLYKKRLVNSNKSDADNEKDTTAGTDVQKQEADSTRMPIHETISHLKSLFPKRERRRQH